MLASKAATFLGKQAIISLQIESEFSKVKRLQEETAEALRILDEGRRFPFGGAFNITADVKRAELGSVLEPEELQHIQTTVQAFASMKDFTAENAETAPNLAEYGAELTQFSRLESRLAVRLMSMAKSRTTLRRSSADCVQRFRLPKIA